MKDYFVTISEASTELTAREKVMAKDTTNAISLDTATADSTNLRFSPDYYVVLDVHNEKAEDKDYKKFVIVDKAGDKYVTGSATFMRSFTEIFDEMKDEDFEIEVYKMPSKNYKGKEFITCSLC